jgi:hypothetical protein
LSLPKQKNINVVHYLFTLFKLGRFEHVQQHFPVRGHSFLPNDRDFGRTETRKIERVYVQEQWYDVMKNARKRNQFEVHEVTQEEITILDIYCRSSKSLLQAFTINLFLALWFVRHRRGFRSGLGSVPPKLVKKIVGKEYIDIWELLPESWHIETDGSCCHAKRPRRSLVTDVNVWTECFATMAAILATAYPDKAPHFFAYLRTITKASRTFESSAWASYDMAFRRQAANRGSLDWGIVDAALYNEAFAGRAKQIPRCKYCLADIHSSPECPHAPDDTGALARNAPRGAG